MIVKLLTEHYLRVPSFKRGCTGSSESTLVKMSHCLKLRVAAQIYILHIFNPYHANIFCLENVVFLFASAAYIQVRFRLDFIMEANNVNPDQTAPKERSDLSTLLQYRPQRYISRRESRRQVMTVGQKVYQ